MNKKVGLCICYNVNNYGSALQCFATVYTVKKLGFEGEIIRYKKDKAFFFKSLPRIFNPYMIEGKYKRFLSKFNRLIRKDYRIERSKRCSKFEEFRSECFKPLFSKVCYGYEALCKSSKDYFCVLSGSDQLWLPSGLSTNFYNLKFVDDAIRRISYASSFGSSSIPWYQKTKTMDYLNRIHCISTRENSGKEIVKNLTGRDVPVVVDPTLLLTRKDWEEQIPQNNIIGKPYLFAYLLGKNKEHRRLVEDVAKKLNLQIVSIPHCDHYNVADVGFGDVHPIAGPKEFVNLVRYADYVCTDSFHGSIFSVLHNKKFVVFERYSKNSIVSTNTRIDSLLKNLNLEERHFKQNLLDELTAPIDYTMVEHRVQEMRSASMDYLRNSLMG
ncbi:MAG: polysaccharide pyruvyl transferase family protein [Fibrobacteraceae bacterium]|nr:polysaccharide pyruvyl transferase family protein [Fibrobacteraceae bacterium]